MSRCTGEVHNGEIVGLLPGQQLVSLPNGLATIINSSQTNIVGQAGVSLLASCAAPGVITNATGAAITSNTIIARPSIPENAGEEDELAAQPSRPTFAVGDYVKLVPEFAAEKARSPQFFGLDGAMRKLYKAVGTVQLVSASLVIPKFKSLDNRSFNCDPRNLIKVNRFSLNQVVQIRSDAPTLKQIENQFKNQSNKLKGEIGQVSRIDEADPSRKLFVKFDDDGIYDWLPRSAPLPSAWMTPYETAHSAIDEELLEQEKILICLFLKAVDAGNLRAAKLLCSRHGVDAEARNLDGKSALHLASFKGHHELVQWLLEIPKVDVHKLDNGGNSALHYAVFGCKGEIIKLLLSKGADFDSQTEKGETSLHFAALHQSRNCSCLELLSAKKANSNLQDAEGNTPLHIAIVKGNAEQMLRHFSFNWGLRNRNGFNIIQQAVILNDLNTVKFILEKDELCQPLLELLPNSQSTVLHYACTNKNYQMAKLLVSESDMIILDRTEILEKFLEARNETGKTALLISCQNKDYSIVELLVEAGADVKAVDQDGNTSILLSDSDPVSYAIPTEEFSPKIYQVYQRALGYNETAKNLFEQYPIISLIAYLIVKGCSLEATNNAGQSGIGAVLSKGSSNMMLNMLAAFVFTSLGDQACEDE